MSDKQSETTPVISRVKNVIILNNPQSGLDIKKLELLEKLWNLDSTNFTIFTVKEKKDNYNQLRGLVADASDLNFFGKIKNKQIREFLKNKYDLMVDFTGIHTPIEKYFSLKISANFRIGYHTSELYYNLMVNQQEKNIPVFIKEITFYLKKLKMI